MGLYRGPKIIRDGLIFGYDSDDRSERFYKGEPTTNLYPGPSVPGNYFISAYNGNYGFGSGTNMQWVIDNSNQPINNIDVQKVSLITGTSTQIMYIEWTGLIGRYNLTFLANEVRSLSFYYYGTYGTQLTPYFGGSSGFIMSSESAISGNGSTSLNIKVEANKWNRISIQITNTLSSSNNFGWGWMILHSNQENATLSTSEYYKFTGIQVEIKSHSTQFTTNSRTATDSLLDLTKNYTIDLTNTKFDSTAHPYFNGGTGEKIITNLTDQLTDFTACVWYKDLGSTGYGRLLDKQYSDGFTIMRESSNANRWGGSILNSTSPYGIYLTLPDGKWHYIVTMRSGSTHYLYGDGIDNKISETCSTTALSAYSLAIGSWSSTNGSAQSFKGYAPVVQVYNRALSEDEIQQNYNALKNRFV